MGIKTLFGRLNYGIEFLGRIVSKVRFHLDGVDFDDRLFIKLNLVEISNKVSLAHFVEVGTLSAFGQVEQG